VAYLAEQHEVWLHSRGVVLQREQRVLANRNVWPRTADGPISCRKT
jgi:hypothetical protein